MSLSWLSSPARIALLPGQAAMADASARSPAADWAGALQALESLLARGKVSGRAHITLSHHFARLFLLPAPATWLRSAEMSAWLAAQLDAPLGGAAGWRFAWRPSPPGRPILVSAMQQASVAELEQILGRHGLALCRLRPWISDAWARRRRKLGGASGWYALAEPGQLVLLHLAAGRIRALRQRQAGGDADADAAAGLHALLTREALMAGVEPGGRVWLERAGVDLDAAALGGGYRVEALAGPRDAARALLS